MKPGAGWPIAVVVVLAATVIANVWLLHAAANPDDMATEPDYYRKAVAWDSTAAEQRRSEALGWSCDAGIAAAGAVRVRLADARGVPVEGARVEVTAIHNLAAAHPIGLTLEPDAPGEYSARMPLARPGLWELRVRATRGAATFVADLRLEAPAGVRP